MAKLSSSELREQVCSAGINYLPAEQMFYTSFPYKIELRPRHRGKGLGGVSGKRSCQIDIANPDKARAELIAFNDRIEKILSNIEYRQEIREFVARLPKVEYKTRMGGDNNLFYLRDPDLVMVVVERYKDVINSVTGPINEEHEDQFGERNVVMRDKLYHNKYRYYLEFERTNEFAENTAPRLIELLETMKAGTWREHKITSLVKFHEIHGSVQGAATSTGMHIPGRQRMRGRLYGYGGMDFPPRAVILYLTNPQDYVYIKLLAAEYIKSCHELVLFDELT
jgi:hypothetical protein